jgi:DDE superfamily endonuclease
MASLVFEMLRGPVGRGAFPPYEQLEVITLATSATAEHNCVASQWSLDDLARDLVNKHADEAMSRSTIGRILQAADLKPHRSVYWLNSHDPDFDTKAHDICKLYVQAPFLYQHGELVICTDEKTGMQILQRKHPTILVQPGKPEKREHEYIRHGTRCLIASFVVPTGKVIWDLGVTRTSIDFAAHLGHVASQFPDQDRFHWIVDNLNTHWSLDVCELMARLNGLPFHKRDLKTGVQRRAFLTAPDQKHVFHFTPKHGSWLNQVELCSVRWRVAS